MNHRIKGIEFLPGFVLLVTFADGRRVEYCPADDLMIDGYNVFECAPAAFETAKVDKRGEWVEWTDSVYVSADMIYENGQPVKE